MAGDCLRLDREPSAQVTLATVHSGRFTELVSRGEHKRMRRKTLRAWIYNLFRRSMRPRLTGNNIGVWRDDFEEVNGFDENYVGWGLEDRDLQRRLALLNIRAHSILPYTRSYHLWHPPHATCVRNSMGTPNYHYYNRPEVAARCARGFAERRQQFFHTWSNLASDRACA